MHYLLDTNILTRLSNANSAEHQPTLQAVRTLAAHGQTLCLVPQVLYEFWTVATRPVNVNGLALPPILVRAEVEAYQRLFPLYPDQPELFDRWLELVTQHQVAGRPTHDARLAAAMQVHGLDALLTRNTDDFKRFGIQVIHPDQVVQGGPFHDPADQER